MIKLQKNYSGYIVNIVVSLSNVDSEIIGISQSSSTLGFPAFRPHSKYLLLPSWVRLEPYRHLDHFQASLGAKWCKKGKMVQKVFEFDTIFMTIWTIHFCTLLPVAWRLFLSCQYIVQFSCSAIKLLLSFSFVKLCLAWFAKAFGPTFCKSLFSTLWLGWWAFKWLLFGINFPLEAVSTQMGALVDPSSFVYFEPRTGKHTVWK